MRVITTMHARGQHAQSFQAKIHSTHNIHVKHDQMDNQQTLSMEIQYKKLHGSKPTHVRIMA